MNDHLLGNRDGGSAGLVVLAPGVLVDGNLASRRGTPGSAASAGGGTLGATEVKGLGQDNDTSLTITKVRDQLAGGRRVDGSSRATTGDALGETLGGARDADSSSVGSEGCNQCSILHVDNEGPRRKVKRSGRVRESFQWGYAACILYTPGRALDDETNIVVKQRQ